MPFEGPVLKAIVREVDSGNPPVINGLEQVKSVMVLPLNVPSTLARTGRVVSTVKMTKKENKTLI